MGWMAQLTAGRGAWACSREMRDSIEPRQGAYSVVKPTGEWHRSSPSLQSSEKR